MNIKPEPTEPRLGLFTSATNSPPGPSKRVKAEPIATSIKRSPSVRSTPLKCSPSRASSSFKALSSSHPKDFKVYNDAAEIVYSPEAAMEHGVRMVDVLAHRIQPLELSGLRKDVWEREIEGLRKQAAPNTLIAVCGATGAGKSSILNAVLDDNIVPTSGFRACTAVVTEISHHKKKTIDADVLFLSETEWRQELEILLDDLVEEDGTVKRCNDLKSDAGVAWSKVHSVYPALAQEQVARMSAVEIIDHDPKIAAVLGRTKNIVARDSKQFAEEIGKYIDSKDKRGKKEKKKSSEKTLLDDARKLAKANKKKKSEDGPALWPLIKQVQVRCAARALETGAVLVDLPGVADANAARNNIAKDYMKKADCIWILAPITRAVDDKTARDLLGDAFKMQLLMDGTYDDSFITFIATKCDDISCSEVIGALDLENEPELEEIQDKLDQLTEEQGESQKQESVFKKMIKGIDGELKRARAVLKEYEEHLDAVKEGIQFTPKLTKRGAKDAACSSKKRKNKRKGKGGSPKRRRSSAALSDDEDEDMDSDSGSSGGSGSEDSNLDSDSDSDGSESEDGSDKDSDAGSSQDDGEEEEEEEATEESLEQHIKETKAKIKDIRERLNDIRQDKKQISDNLAVLKKSIAKSQRTKASFCSRKRSEYSKDVLREDFRTGLKDLDDAHAEERNPDTFDPSQNLRDYEAINLPVFTVSARDYVRIKGQIKGDGEPSCFTNPDDTEVPALQSWCRSLTENARERTARNILTQLATFCKTVQSYTRGIGDVTAIDRASLKEKWETAQVLSEDDAPMSDADDEDPFEAILGGQMNALYTMPSYVPKVSATGQPIGIRARLNREFEEVIVKCEKDLQSAFSNGLEAKCREGAVQGSAAAVQTVDTFASGIHWATYRATLRRHGSFRQDLNVELANPFTKSIAQQWGRVFEQQLFKGLQHDIERLVHTLINAVEESAAAGLKDRTRLQGKTCIEEANVALQNAIANVNTALTASQKEISRSISPGIQSQLSPGYERAMEERGRGSVARQKTFFHNFVSEVKEDLFEDSSDAILSKLNEAAKAAGNVLRESTAQLAEKAEVNMSVLWEGVRDDPQQVRARADLIRTVESALGQIDLLKEAADIRKSQVRDDADHNIDMQPA